MGLHVGPYLDVEKSVSSKNLSCGSEFVFNQRRVTEVSFQLRPWFAPK